MTKRIYLSLGSNLGDRQQNLQLAVNRIAEAGVKLLRSSSCYETEPMYLSGQPMFLNLVLEGDTGVLPRLLLKRLQAIERDLGRRRLIRNGPRTIDIDILLYGSVILAAPDLVTPHPRLAERRFVLQPLAELAPDLRHPVSRRTIAELLEALPPGGVVRTDFVPTL